MQACFWGYAHVSWTIWVNFTQETKKFLKLQEYELKLKIWSLHDEALVEMIKMDIWNTWFGAQTRKLLHFKNALVCKSGSSGLGNRRVLFSRIRPEFELRFSPYLVKILWFVERAMSCRLYICRSRLIVTSLRPNQWISRSFTFLRVRVNTALLLPRISLPLINLHRC
jgi:hypothetical protein